MNTSVDIEIHNALSPYDLPKALSAEMDEMWSYYHDKKHQIWLWWAVDHANNVPLAFTFGVRTDDVLCELLILLEQYN